MSESYTPHNATSSSGTGTPPNGAQFVGWVPENSLKKGPPRLYHKKSRNGCQHCRSRRVKCDEVHPICGGCQRHHVTCIYDRPTPIRVSERLTSNNARGSDAKSKAKGGKNATSVASEESPEDRKRRLLELKLLHQYMTKTSWSISLRQAGSAEQMTREVWATAIPRLAFEHDSLMYAICCIAAMHIAKEEPDNLEAIEAYSTYLELSLREHRIEVANLTRDNADSACMTSTVIRICSFAILQDRELEPYRPPTHWLAMTKEAAMVFKESWAFIGDEPTSVARAIVTGTPQLTDNGAVFRDNGPRPWDLKAQFGESNRRDLLHILARDRNNEENERWDEEVQDAYKSTLSYIGSVQIAIAAAETSSIILRRLISFPMLIQKQFIDLVAEQQPRALVVLAHYFALLARFSHFWWIGDTGQREILGIQSFLPDEWQHLLEWPLQAMEAGLLL